MFFFTICWRFCSDLHFCSNPMIFSATLMTRLVGVINTAACRGQHTCRSHDLWRFTLTNSGHACRKKSNKWSTLAACLKRVHSTRRLVQFSVACRCKLLPWLLWWHQNPAECADVLWGWFTEPCVLCQHVAVVFKELRVSVFRYDDDEIIVQVLAGCSENGHGETDQLENHQFSGNFVCYMLHATCYMLQATASSVLTVLIYCSRIKARLIVCLTLWM